MVETAMSMVIVMCERQVVTASWAAVCLLMISSAVSAGGVSLTGAVASSAVPGDSAELSLHPMPAMIVIVIAISNGHSFTNVGDFLVVKGLQRFFVSRLL